MKTPLQDEKSMIQFYGQVGTGMTQIVMPFPLKLAWETDTIVRKVTCHEKCADSFLKIWKETLDHYGADKISRLRLDLFGGCLNVRKMRGGSSWSIHSWGAAWDTDPDMNQLRWGADKAEFAKADYDPFWRIVESNGGVSLGREKNYDWMHFQFARFK
jgi:hypothetical protein